MVVRMIVRIVRKIRMKSGVPVNVFEVVPLFGGYQVLHEAETIQDAVQWLQSQGYTLEDERGSRTAENALAGMKPKRLGM